MHQLLSSLEQQGHIDEESILGLLGFGAIDILSRIVERRQALVKEWAAVKANASQMLGKAKEPKVLPGQMITVSSQSAKLQGKADRKLRKAQEKGTANEEQAVQLIQRIAHKAEMKARDAAAGFGGALERISSGAAPASSAPMKSSSDAVMVSDSSVGRGTLGEFGLGGVKRALPEGTKKTTGPFWENVYVPPPKKTVKLDDHKLVRVEELPEWAQTAFKGKHGATRFNTIQSKVFSAVYASSDNVLVSAPTGAGKTNVAVLSILRLVSMHMDPNGVLQSDFKCIYLAPMKALVAEVVEKFQQRLGPIGLQVREMTGDMSLTAKELAATHVIVTVPEKYDVLTRNSSSGGGSSDTGLLSQVQLLIIDEVHLLNEDRGAVIEAIVARTFRFQETSGNYVRVLGLSATLPNYGDVAQFLRVNERNTFHFGDEYRPIPLERTFIGIHADSYFQRVTRFNEMCYDKVWESVKAGHQVMVFVHSRAETAKTAEALIRMAEEKEQISRFTGPAMEVQGYHEIKFQTACS